MNYCSQCGSSLSLLIPPNDDRERYVCKKCSYVHYQNPLIVVCSVPCYEDKVLLCKRAIEPRYGLWTLPGGFMENAETTHEAAIRETMEEARARINLHDLYTLYSLPHINQVHLFFRADLLNQDFSCGAESLEVKLFRQDEVPWNEIAFTAVKDTLLKYFEDRKLGHFPMRCSAIRVELDTYSIDALY